MDATLDRRENETADNWLLLARETMSSPLPSAKSLGPDIIDEDGLWIGKRRRGGRFVRYPDGELRQVDPDFDTSVFDDPESCPASEANDKRQTAGEIEVPDVLPSSDSVQAIAQAMLDTSPTALVAIYHDAKGTVLGSTITPAKRGLTAAVFRAALRSLPSRAKQVTFAAHGRIARDVRNAATLASEVCLVRVLDFIGR